MILYNNETNRITGSYYATGENFDVPLYDHIIDNLYLGGNSHGELPEIFEHVITLYRGGSYVYPRHVKTIHSVLLDDNIHEGVDTGLVLRTARLANDCALDGPTLVSCQVGLNRSGMVLAAALVLQGYSAEEAISLLREKRSTSVLCNSSFEQWVYKLYALRMIGV